MSIIQEGIILGIIIGVTMFTRFLPFLIFSSNKPIPPFVERLGKVLPSAVFGFLVIYCLRDVTFFSGDYGTPELLSLSLITIVHFWKRNMLVSIATGTVFYMGLVQYVM